MREQIDDPWNTALISLAWSFALALVVSHYLLCMFPRFHSKPSMKTRKRCGSAAQVSAMEVCHRLRLLTLSR
jgi:hypothetical protein